MDSADSGPVEPSPIHRLEEPRGLRVAEERGLGLRTMRERASAAGLPLPFYKYKAPYVVLTMHHDAASVTGDESANKALSVLNEAERAGWAWLVTRERVTSPEYEEALELPNRTALNHFKHMTERRLLRRVGAGRATYYEVVGP